MRPTPRLAALALLAALSSAAALCPAQEAKLAKGEAGKIAEEALIYGLPLVMNYGTMHAFTIDSKSPQYKAPFNRIYNTARVFTPKDTVVVTPNSDTPYSFVSADLRAEPLVLTMPAVEKGRYYSVQMVDMYTANYAYLGSRTTGNGPGSYLLAGPNWKGEAPAGVKKVIRCETDFSVLIYRTQLFRPDDIENVKKVQAGYQVQTLSQYLKKPAPPAAKEVDWPAINEKLAATNPFAYLNFVLQFCPPTGPAKVEKDLRERFAKIGIVAGKPFSLAGLSAEQKLEVVAGAKAGVAKVEKAVAGLGKEVNGWRVSTDAFGDRAMLNGNWLVRAAAAKAGIYGNDAAEAMYPMLAKDADGQEPDCSKHNYTLTFAAGQLPPVNAFWSVTMYDRKTQLLVANPIDRYLINSPMLPGLKKNADGSVTLYIQKASPGKDKESNWLPAPAGKIFVVMRLYWPKETALKGEWRPPVVQRAK